jgi:putative FmdB family regulatory protein
MSSEGGEPVPVYEFFCPACHTIFNFFSRRVNTDKHPHCPRCGRPELERQVSRFAVSKGRQETEGNDGMPDMDDSGLERAMQTLASAADGLDAQDPRQAARRMRQLAEAMGIPLGSGMEEAMRRMEAGEDPEQIEADMGDLLEAEAPVGGVETQQGGQPVRPSSPRPQVDPTLYEL